jgi:hypothetical protein
MNPNTMFHFSTLAYIQKMQWAAQDKEPEQLEWSLRLAAVLRILWNLLTALVNHAKQEQSLSTPTLEHAAN